MQLKARNDTVDAEERELNTAAAIEERARSVSWAWSSKKMCFGVKN